MALPLQVGQVVAQRLLVEARLTPAWLIAIGRPEARRIGSQDLVDDEQRPVGGATELEFRVRDDDAVLGRIRPSGFVQAETRRLEPLRRLAAHRSCNVSEAHVLVVTRFRLGRGRKDRWVQALAFSKAFRQPLAGERARLLVLRPCRAGEVATHDTFEWHGCRALRQHRPPSELLAMCSEFRHAANDLIDVGAEAVVGHHCGEKLEPEGAHLREYRALVWHGLSHDDVERADTIAGDEQQGRIIDGVDFADFTAPHERKWKFALEQNPTRHTSTSAAAAAGAAA